jgi:hypothetical protein
LVLLKASRSAGLERLAEALRTHRVPSGDNGKDAGGNEGSSFGPR